MARITKIEGTRVAKNLPDASIPQSTTFTGDIDTMGGVRVDGKVKGNASAGGDITIGVDGTIEGNVKACNVNIAGKVIGNLTVAGAVQMLSGSKLTGDLTASSFAIEQGAYFKGHCTITDSKEPAMLNAGKPEETQADKKQEDVQADIKQEDVQADIKQEDVQADIKQEDVQADIKQEDVQADIEQEGAKKKSKAFSPHKKKR